MSSSDDMHERGDYHIMISSRMPTMYSEGNILSANISTTCSCGDEDEDVVVMITPGIYHNDILHDDVMIAMRWIYHQP